MRLSADEAKRIAASRKARRAAARKAKRRMGDGLAYPAIRMSRRRLKAWLGQAWDRRR